MRAYDFGVVGITS